jgi:hypothetical protein
MNNLPDGLKESDIPGNRPEDAIYERLFEKLDFEIQAEIKKQTNLGIAFEQQLEDFISKIFTEDDVIREMTYIKNDIIDSLERYGQ